MIRYFLGRDLAHRLQIPLARWKRWAREFLPPDPLGGLQSGYARHYSIDQAFTVYLSGHLVSRSRYSIPESRQILSDLEHWLDEQGYRTGAAEKTAGENRDAAPAIEHLVIIERYPPGCGNRPVFGYDIRGVLAHRQWTRQGRLIVEERYRGYGPLPDQSHRPHYQALEQHLIWITRILKHFVGCLDLDAHLFAALRPESERP